MYKALFELSADRAEFMSRLFTKQRPPGLGPKSTAAEIQNAFWDVPTEPREASTTRTSRRSTSCCSRSTTCRWCRRTSPASTTARTTTSTGSVRASPTTRRAAAARGNYINYAELMMATDSNGVSRSFLASEENFRVLKDLHERNLIVPIVGDFAGPESASGGRPLHQGQGRHRHRLLSLERRAVPAAQRRLAELLPQRRGAAARRAEHVHPIRAGRQRRARRRAGQSARIHAVGNQPLRGEPGGFARRQKSAMTHRRSTLAGLIVVLAVVAWSSGPAALRRGRSAGTADRAGILEAHRRPVRAQRLLPVRQPGLERAGLRPHPARAGVDDEAGWRVPRRRAGTELHLHRGHQTEDGVPHRHPPGKPAAAPGLQGGLRSLGRPRRFPGAAVHQGASGRPLGAVHGGGSVPRVRRRAHRIRGHVPGEPAGDRERVDEEIQAAARRRRSLRSRVRLPGVLSRMARRSPGPRTRATRPGPVEA